MRNCPAAVDAVFEMGLGSEGMFTLQQDAVYTVAGQWGCCFYRGRMLPLQRCDTLGNRRVLRVDTR